MFGIRLPRSCGRGALQAVAHAVPFGASGGALDPDQLHALRVEFAQRRQTARAPRPPASSGMRRCTDARSRRPRSRRGNIPPASSGSAPSSSSAARSSSAAHQPHAWRAARSAPRACRGRAATRRRGSRSGSPRGRLELLARERARAQQHRRGRACSRRWSIRCRPAQSPPSSTGSVGAELVDARAPPCVGLTRPKRLALGAATPGTPSASAPSQQRVRHRMRRAAQADAWPGRRPRPRRHAGARGTITVSGPGQNASIRRCADGGIAAAKRSRLRDVGDVHDQRVVARPALGGEDRATAASSSARAPRP